ncbi:hypothetical protein BH23GEM7_BH23GEM7_25630 [soil metagenome]
MHMTNHDAAVAAEAVPGAPGLSVVLATDSWATIQPVVERLAAQTLRASLELIFATPDPERFMRDAGTALDGFGRIEVVAAPLEELTEARALAIRRATAPYVFIGETHTYPYPSWAEAVLRGHAKWDVVVPAFDNANPKGSLSWGAFLCDYGWWSEGLEEGELRWWPTTNASYPRRLLLECGEALDQMLQPSDQMWREVHARGMRAGFVADARIDHANVATPAAWIRERYLSGLVVGGHRRAHWSVARRIVYAGGGPLLIPLLLKRTYGALERARRRTRLPLGATMAWALGTVIRACGETVGYLKGVSTADRDLMNEYEIHKLRHSGR